MQNLALLHFCLAFPTVPDVERYKNVAIERLVDQLGFYINDEGVTLEHSPGYHKVGLEFLSKAMRYLTLLGITPPATWVEKHRKAQDVYAQLRLPDGRLPLFGDTLARPDRLGPLVADLDVQGRAQGLEYRRSWAPVEAASVYPVAGYAAWWHGLDRWPDAKGLAQTVISWSYFPGHAHKHADEMSLSVWAGGQTWWSNLGYWPYQHSDRANATSWSASNAPHLVGEPAAGRRQSRLRSYRWSDELAFIDLERRGPSGYAVRRQIVWKKPALWVVVDCSTAQAGRSRTVWTTAPEVRMETGPVAGSFTLHGANDNVFVDALFFGTANTSIKALRGSVTPFAGWGIVDTTVKPASAVVVEQPADDGCGAAVWSLRPVGERAKSMSGVASFVRSETGQGWSVSFPTRSGNVSVQRAADSVSVVQDSRETKATNTLRPQHRSDYSNEYELIRRNRVRAGEKYPKYSDYYRYRLILSWLVVGAFVGQEGVLAFLKRKGSKRYAAARWVTLCLWLAVGSIVTAYLPNLADVYSSGRQILRLGR
jgi:hypothetical protein